jgi:hypothetical protein
LDGIISSSINRVLEGSFHTLVGNGLEKYAATGIMPIKIGNRSHWAGFGENETIFGMNINIAMEIVHL